MRFRKQPMNRKARIVLACGCLCLSIGLGLPMLIEAGGGTARPWMDGVRGLLIGLAIGLNFSALLLSRKCESDASRSQMS